MVSLRVNSCVPLREGPGLKNTVEWVPGGLGFIPVLNHYIDSLSKKEGE